MDHSNTAKNSSPLVSIITPVLNGEKFIEETIKSVLRQSYRNIEYIIIDGGSSDCTLEIVNRYIGDISVFISERDDGIYDAMNKGIDNCRGDIIGIINSDDYYDPHAVRNIVEKFLSIDTESCAIYGNLNVVDSEGNVVKIENKTNHQMVIPRLSMWVPHPCLFVSRQVYKNYGNYDASYNVIGDLDFLVRLIKSEVNFYKIDITTSNFRIGGLTYTNSYQYQRKIDKERFKLVLKNGLPLYLFLCRTIIGWFRFFIKRLH